MTSRATNFVLAAVTCVVVSASVVTTQLSKADAAEDCLAAPRKDTPAGQHWFYKSDRATKRRCWYLSDPGDARAAKSTPRQTASLDKPRGEDPPARSAADAYDELPQGGAARDTLRAEDTRLATSTDRTPAVEPGTTRLDPPRTESAETPQAPAAPPWPEPAGARAQASEPPSSSTVVAAATSPSTAVAAVTPDADADNAATADPAPPVVPVAMARSEPLPARPTNTIGALLLAFGAAMIFVGLIGAATYYMTGGPRRARTRAWPRDLFDEPARLPSWLDSGASTPGPDPAHWSDAQQPTRPHIRLVDEMSELERLRRIRR